MALQALPGFRDFFPAELARRAHIFDAMRRVARRYGFEEYDGPPLEPLELYTDKSGPEIIAQLYTFVDKGDRSVALTFASESRTDACWACCSRRAGSGSRGKSWRSRRSTSWGGRSIRRGAALSKPPA